MKGFYVFIMQYEKKRLKEELSTLRRKIQEYMSKPNRSDNYLIWMEKLYSSIENYMKEVDSYHAKLIDDHNKELAPHILVIKKQALIIEAANIQYPTINQSLGYITDVYKASKGMVDELGNGENINISIRLHP